jgi:drug/metabolite transporter (DMT)-like permease
MAMLASSLSAVFPWQWIAVGRSTVPFIVCGIIAWKLRIPLPIWKPRILWLRSIAGSTSLVFTFFSLTRLPSSDVMTLTNIFPIWVALASWPLLGQRPSRSVWLCIAVALTGVVLVLQPHFDEGNFATFVALAASVSTTVAMLGLHRLHQVDPRAIVWHFSAVSFLFSFGAMLLFNVAPRGNEPATVWSWLTLVGVGASALAGQFCLTKAFTTGTPSRVSVVGLTQVGFTMLFEIVLVGRSYNVETLLGMVLVLTPTAWLLTHPAASQRQSTTEATA